VEIKINGTPVSVEEGKTVLEACRGAGVYIPTLCHDDRLEPYGGCRLCVVEIKGVPRPLTACTTPVTDGMEITTDSKQITDLRRSVLSLILSDHPNDCMACDKTGACDLQDLAYLYNVRPDTIEGIKRNLPIRDDNPFIYFDPNKCILCGRCVRICHEVVMKGTIDLTGRGFTTIPDTAFRSPRNPDNCVFCGQCISTCPVGALVEKKARGKGRIWEMQKVRTTCPYCGVGCQQILHVKNGRIIKVTGVEDAEPNKGRLCVKGRFGYDFIYSDDRIRTPLIREKGGALREASWDEALDLVAAKFKQIIAESGPDALAGVSCARSVNEDSYNMQKLFRSVFKTNNIDHCART
jgi:predicted molibdopterin-dependent oxidoreductase YjgC